jgi:hypothetical protein
MKWLCTLAARTLVIACDGTVTAIEARSFAAQRMGDVPEIERVDEEALEDVWLRWTGSDYSHGGGPGRRRLQVREKGSSQWKDV